jgi:predicted RNA-binding protein with PIN domain
LGAGSSTVTDETRDQGRHRGLESWQAGIALAAAAGQLGSSAAEGRVADAARALPARMAQAQLRAGTRDAARLALEAERALLHLDGLIEVGLLEGAISEDAAQGLRGHVDGLLDLLHGRPSPAPISAYPPPVAPTADLPPAALAHPAPEPVAPTLEAAPTPIAALPPEPVPTPAPVIPPVEAIRATTPPIPPVAAPSENGKATSLFAAPVRPVPVVDRLIVDGCNFLGRARGFDLGDPESRDRLLFRLQEYARKHPAHRILVFFDGQHASRRVTAGIEERIVSADRTADDGIVAFIQNLPAADRPRAALVTDDRELMRRVMAEGARRESVAWLAERINRKASAPVAEGPVRREGGLSRNELEDWEQFFSQPPDRPGKG